jgi:hypothetical protein
MPGFNRTGPLGEGPRTGRGLGKCGKAENSQGSAGGRRSKGKQGTCKGRVGGRGFGRK